MKNLDDNIDFTTRIEKVKDGDGAVIGSDLVYKASYSFNLETKYPNEKLIMQNISEKEFEEHLKELMRQEMHTHFFGEIKHDIHMLIDMLTHKGYFDSEVNDFITKMLYKCEGVKYENE